MSTNLMQDDPHAVTQAPAPAGATGCSHGWSAARPTASGAQPVETVAHGASPSPPRDVSISDRLESGERAGVRGAAQNPSPDAQQTERDPSNVLKQAALARTRIPAPAGATGCSHGWSAARRMASGAQP